MFGVSLLRGFCFKCGPNAHRCEYLKADNECPEVKVFTTNEKSFKTVTRLWRASRRVERKKRTRVSMKEKCDDPSSTVDMCFEDDWFD